MALIAYQDPEHDGNSAKYHTGKQCSVKGCTDPAGTWWGAHWCFKHNVERLDRIGATLEDMTERAKFAKMVDEAVTSWRRTCQALIKERNGILRAAGGSVTATKDQMEREANHESCKYHEDGSKTFYINP